MGMMSEFKSFAMRGNVVDLAVGVVIGAAFGKIVSSLVKDVIMPPIGVVKEPLINRKNSGFQRFSKSKKIIENMVISH